MDRSKGYVIAASAVAAAAVIGIAAFMLGASAGSSALIPDNNGGNSTSTASSGEPPRMLLVVLQGNEDSSSAVAQYEANNTEPIHLASNAHVRFDSPDRRTAESMKVLARNMDSGDIQLLRKSYDVNNEFFINLGKGAYQLQVQASWFEAGNHNYNFNIAVT